MEILRSDPKNDVYHQPHENAVWGGHFFDFCLDLSSAILFYMVILGFNLILRVKNQAWLLKMQHTYHVLQKNTFWGHSAQQCRVSEGQSLASY